MGGGLRDDDDDDVLSDKTKRKKEKKKNPIQLESWCATEMDILTAKGHLLMLRWLIRGTRDCSCEMNLKQPHVHSFTEAGVGQG